MELVEKASKVYLENFKAETCFERAIFFSWYCKVRSCKFCYMSTQEKADKKAVRSPASLLAEAVICKKLGWEIGFFSGGYDAYTTVKFKEILKAMHSVLGGKFWINVGALKKQTLKEFLPYTKGVVASIETINPKIHDFVCPDKSAEPYEKMLVEADKLKLKKAITIIIGLGETINDYPKLKEFLKKYRIDKIHFYALNPHKGTVFENNKPIDPNYQAEWIAKTRIDFPKIDIQAGIWTDKVQNVSLLLKAGANSISKFPSIRLFNSTEAKEIEAGAKKAKRKFNGTLTKMPKIDVEKEVNKLKLDEKLKQEVKKKLERYLKVMKKH